MTPSGEVTSSAGGGRTCASPSAGSKLFCEVLLLPEEILVILTVIAAAAIGALLAFVAYAFVAPF